MSHRFLAFAALGILASAIVPSTSHAQLGKLTKKATDAAGNAAGVPNSNARYVKKIDLTSAQLNQVNKGLAQSVKVGPETIKKWEKQQADYEKANADHEKANADYTKKQEKYDQCVESEKAKAQGKIEAANNKANAASERAGKSVDTASMMAQAQAAQAAAERVKNGTATAADRQTLADFQKTMAGVSAGSNASISAMQESSALQQAVADSIKKKCGEEPKQPAAVGGGGAAGGAPTSAAEDINKQGAEAAGMSDSEFRMAKEKAMGYAASNTQVQGGSDTPDDEAKSINDALGQTRDLMAQARKANVPLM